MIPNKKAGLIPAKNGDDIGIADKTNQKFYKLDNAYFLTWQLCDGKRSIEDVSKEFARLVSQNMKNKTDIDEKLLLEDIKKIVERLKKFGLLDY